MAKNRNKRVFPTQYSESVEIGTFEAFTRPSMTEPDNAMSIPEIIAKFTRGYGVQVQQHPWTSGDAFGDQEDPNDIDTFMNGPKAPQEPAPQEPVPQEPAPVQAPPSEGQ